MELVHLTEAEVELYLERRMASAGILRVHDHIAACPECAQSVARLRQRSGQTEALPLLLDDLPYEGSHADEDELIQLAAGQLTPAARTRVEAHIATCFTCREAIEDLRTFREELQRDRSGVVSMPSPAHPKRKVWWLGVLAAAAGVALVFLALPRPGVQQASPVGPKHLAALHDANGLVGITQSGDLTGGPEFSGDERSLLQEALRGVLPRGPAGPAGGGKHLLRGGPVQEPMFQLLSPIGRVLPDRPEFEWSALNDATGYEVKVFDADYSEVARSGRLTSNRWQPQKALPRGQTYAWQVTAIRKGQRITAPIPPQPEATFAVLDGFAANRLDHALALTPRSHLLLAALYAGEGLRKEAATELGKLEELNPGSSIVDSLRRSLDAPQLR